jgi:fatty-acyl-CoA synthase
LRDWAGERVAERAAAPKEVVVLDSLPITDVGKPYKLPLRADATRRELSSALDEIDEVRAVHVAVDDGSVVATVEVGSPADEATVRLILDRYAVTWKVVMKP